MKCAKCDMQYTTCDMEGAKCDMKYTMCDMEGAKCDMKYTTCDMQCAYLDTEPISPCHILIMPSAKVGSDKYQF